MLGTHTHVHAQCNGACCLCGLVSAVSEVGLIIFTALYGHSYDGKSGNSWLPYYYNYTVNAHSCYVLLTIFMRWYVHAPGRVWLQESPETCGQANMLV